MTQNCITVWDRHSACGTTGDENLRPYPCLSHPLASKQDLPGGPGAGRPVQDAAEEKQPRKFGSARATEKCAAPGLGACAQQRRTRIPAILLRSRSSSSRGWDGAVTTEHKQPSTCTGARRLLSSATPLLCVSSIAFVQRWECGALRTWRGVHLEPADVLGRVSGNCPDTTPPLCPVGAAARCVGEDEDDEEDEARVKAARDNVVRRRAPTSSSFLRVQGG